MTFDTLDCPKKSDIAVTVQVLGRPDVIAHYNGFGASNNAHCAYGKGDHHVLNLENDLSSYAPRGGATQLRIRIGPSGKNIWTFRYTLTARTLSGAWEQMKSGYGHLSSAHPEITTH